MYFVYRPYEDTQDHEWYMIDFKHKGLRHGWALNDPYNDRVFSQDIYKKIKANPEKFLIVEARDFDSLQKTKEYKDKWDAYVLSAIEPDSNLGWIAPDGTFIGCNYHNHEFIATYYLKSSEKDLEESGWCKVYASLNDLHRGWINVYTKNMRFTSAQKETLKMLYNRGDVHGPLAMYAKLDDAMYAKLEDNENYD